MFRHSPELWGEFPDLVAGVVWADGVHPDAAPDLAGPLARAAARLAEAPESGWPEVVAWRRAFSRLGVAPTRYRCASEALLRRYRRDAHLPRVHPLVDLCNAVSMASGVPVAALDVERIAFPLEVRRARGDEEYRAFSGEVERPEPGEVVFADRDGRAHARRWTNRQSAASAVSASTRRVLVVAEGLHAGADRDVAGVVAELADGLDRWWGVTPTTAVLTAADPATAPPFAVDH